MANLEAGTQIGKYILTELIGYGGMGEVWKGHHQTLTDIAVAIKVLHAGDALLEEQLHRFMQEAQILARLGEQRHIVLIRDLDMIEDRPCIVMSYMPNNLAHELGDISPASGDTLNAMQPEVKQISVSDALRIVREICEGLRVAHCQGVIHRDLKPANVLLTEDGTVRLCDFGIARMMSETGLTATQVGMGSMGYTAPEVMQGGARVADERADIYSVGAILLRMITGHLPMGHFGSLKQFCPDIDDHLEQAIFKCLNVLPEARFACVEDVLEALENPSVASPGEIAGDRDGGSQGFSMGKHLEAQEKAAKAAAQTATGSSISADLREMWEAHEARLKSMNFVIPNDQDLVIRNPKDDGIALWIPPGEFYYGDNKELETITKGFYLDVYPVTNAQYARFISETGDQTPRCIDGSEADWNMWIKRHPPKGYENHPVVGVSWEDATAYCEWSGKRLSTALEWEYGARGVDGRLYPWGEETPTAEYANFDRKLGKTSPVGDYPKGISVFGMLDMSGNVWEWCNDVKDKDKHGASRGGSWYNFTDYIRCAYHAGYASVLRRYDVGFRCARQK